MHYNTEIPTQDTFQNNFLKRTTQEIKPIPLEAHILNLHPNIPNHMKICNQRKFF